MFAVTPRQLTRWLNAAYPWLVVVTLIAFAVGLTQALWLSPPDYQQGQAVRILYVHVPAAWLCSMIYAGMALAAGLAIVYQAPLGYLICQAAAPIGLTMTGLTLITGALWGKPMWGTWWVWDARLTSVFVLFFLYLSYMVVAAQGGGQSQRQQGTHQGVLGRGQKIGAWLLVLGAIDLPLIRFSVEWWQTLHQPASVLRRGGVAMPGSMLSPLLWMALAYSGYGLLLFRWRLLTLLRQHKQRAASWRLMQPPSPSPSSPQPQPQPNQDSAS